MAWITGYSNTEARQRLEIRRQGLAAVVLAALSASMAAFLAA
jgi:hypothetical protein